METAQRMLPREKMQHHGIGALSDAELLALFLRTGTRGMDLLTFAERLLQRFGSLRGLLQAPEEELKSVEGIGIAKYAQLKGITELARRSFSLQLLEEDPIRTPDATRDFLHSQFCDEEREIFIVIFLRDGNVQRPLRALALLTRLYRAGIRERQRRETSESLRRALVPVIIMARWPGGEPGLIAVVRPLANPIAEG